MHVRLRPRLSGAALGSSPWLSRAAARRPIQVPMASQAAGDLEPERSNAAGVRRPSEPWQ